MRAWMTTNADMMTRMMTYMMTHVQSPSFNTTTSVTSKSMILTGIDHKPNFGLQTSGCVLKAGRFNQSVQHFHQTLTLFKIQHSCMYFNNGRIIVYHWGCLIQKTLPMPKDTNNTIKPKSNKVTAGLQWMSKDLWFSWNVLICSLLAEKCLGMTAQTVILVTSPRVWIILINHNHNYIISNQKRQVFVQYPDMKQYVITNWQWYKTTATVLHNNTDHTHTCTHKLDIYNTSIC